MLNSEFFTDELELIQDQRLKDFTTRYVDVFPDYFSEKPSSSTGKYHAKWSNGSGGLRRHTKAVAQVVHDYSDMFDLTPMEHDAAIVAALGHDAVKYGLPEQKYTTSDHPAQGAMFFLKVAKMFNCTDMPMGKAIYTAIADHMGRWNKHYPTPRNFPEDFPKLSQLVHIADVAASRSNVSYTFLEENLIA